jgi:hypothetical protein
VASLPPPPPPDPAPDAAPVARAGTPGLPWAPGTGTPATDWPAPRQVPTSYPGTAPDHPYLLVGDEVVPLDVSGDAAGLRVALADGTPVDRVLAGLGAAPLAERVPVLAYGANRSPHTLALKMAHHGRRDGPPVAVPVLAGTLTGLDVVAAGLSSQGFIYADVVPSPGTRVTVLLTLLDPDQAAAVHDSEGVGRGMYDCALIDGFDVAGAPGLTLEVVAYAGCRPVFVSPEAGSPLAFAAIAAEGRRFAADDQVGITAHVLRSTGVAAELAALVGSESDDPREAARDLARLLSGQWWYTHNTQDQPLAVARRVERLVAEALARHGAPRSTADRLGDEGKVLPPDVAYASGPELRLAAQVAVAPPD